MFDQEVSSNLGPLARCWWVSVLLTLAQIHSWLPQDASWALEHRGSTLLLVVHLVLTPLHSSLHYQKEPKLRPVPGPLPQQLPLKKKKKKPGGCTLTSAGSPSHSDSCSIGQACLLLGFITHSFYASTLCFDSWETQGTEKRIPSLLSTHLQSHEQVWNSFMNRTGLEPGAFSGLGEFPASLSPLSPLPDEWCF